MDRRDFLGLAAASAGLGSTDAPRYRVVSGYRPAAVPGMPGRYRGRVVRIHAPRSIDPATGKVDPAMVGRALSRGMRTLTGTVNDRDAWGSFFESGDVVGIKLNCSGAPNIRSSPEVVAAIVQSLMAVDIPASNIYLYERFPDQVNSVHYERYVPAGVHIVTIEKTRGSIAGYDPNTYVETDFFGEDDTRSNLIRLVSERFTKVINVPNMKDHQAAGVTGCLKNIAYGNFSNVARSHRDTKTNTLTFIGTLANVEPLRSRTVLQVMDGLAGVWHGGPFADYRQFRFYPRQIVLGTDPVAVDRLLLDVIEEKRKAEGAISVWDRDPKTLGRGHNDDPNVNHFVREPGHIEYASKLGLGVYDKQQIQVTSLEI